MEEVLYDLYLAEGMVNGNHSLFSSDSARKQQMLNSVLKKHKITEAKLDSSIAWYTAHLDQFFKINNRLSERYVQEIALLQDLESQSAQADTQGETRMPYAGDTVTFLNALTLPSHVYSFRADTVMDRHGGEYEVRLFVLGVNEKIRPELTLYVKAPDSIHVARRVIETNGWISESVRLAPVEKFEGMYGTLRFPEMPARTNLYLNPFDLILHKTHRPIEKSLGSRAAAISEDIIKME